MSETARCRERLAPYCIGDGLDVGFGFDLIVPHAIGFDLPKPYAKVGNDQQHLRGDCRSLPFKDETLDFVFSSHLLEDFSYEGQLYIIHEWMRVLKVGGVIVMYQPDQKRFEAHCAKTGQGLNPNHVESDYSLENLKSRVISWIPCVGIVHEADMCEDYSFEIVLKKLA